MDIRIDTTHDEGTDHAVVDGPVTAVTEAPIELAMCRRRCT